MTLSALVRRCAQFIPVFFGITVLSFALIHLAPSDPVSVRLSLGGIAVDPAAAAQMRTEMGLDRPLPIQYGDWLMRFLHGDMGTSYRSDRPVAAMLLQALPYTLAIAASAMLLTLLISLPLGIACGYSLIYGLAQGLQNDIYRMPVFISPAAYAIATLTTLASAALSALIIARQLRRLDLIEVLKTRE